MERKESTIARDAAEPHAFEALLADVFARIASVEAEGTDEVIAWALGKVIPFLGGQRGGLFLFSEDKKHLDFNHHWNADGVKLSMTPGPAAVPAYKLDWVIERIRRGGLCIVPDRDKLPEEAVVYLTLLEEMRIQATVNVPIMVKGSLAGIFGFGSAEKEHVWSDANLSRLKLVAQVFSGALERKQAGEELARANERYRMAAAAASEIVYDLDLATGKAVVHGDIDASLGYEPGEIDPTLDWWLENLHPEDRERSEQALEATIRTGEDRQEEMRMRTKQGTYRNWNYRSTAVKGADGETVRVVGTVADVTKVREAEGRLKRAEERFRMAAQLACDYIWEADLASGELHFFGSRLEKDSAFPASEIPRSLGARNGDWWRKHLHPDDVERVSLEFRNLVEKGDRFQCEFRIRAMDESYRHWIEHADVSRDANGKPAKIIGAIFDVSEQRNVESALKESEALHRAILDSVPEEVVVLNREGVILSVNDTWERFAVENEVASTQAVSSGVNYLDACNAMGSDDEELARQAGGGVRAVLDGTKKEFSLEYPCHGPDKARWFLMNVVPLRLPDGGAVVSHTNITHLKQSEENLRKAYVEIQALKDRLQQENIYLREQADVRHEHEDIVGESVAITDVLREVEQVAASGTSVLIQGETGTGKELVASAIHNLSPRKEHPMVKVNCGALPANLVESELFGREKGAYTGALTRQSGRFELADKSTIFLDEVGELPAELQAKLLRVLESGEFERLGSPVTIKVDVRVIAATNRDLAREVEAGNFREDLYYRLNVFPINVPPLRVRPEDIPLLVWAFVREFAERSGKQIETVSKTDLEKLQRYPWPGNVRELRNVIERAVILSAGRKLRIAVPDVSTAVGASNMTLEEVERNYITKVLDTTAWQVRGKRGAAAILGLNEGTLRSRMKKLGIERSHTAS